MEELIDVLRSQFKLDQAERDIVTSLFTRRKYGKLESFSAYGEFSREMGFVVSGILRAYYQKDNGEQYNKTFFTSGDFTGAYSSLVTGNKNLIDIQCLTSCELLVADYMSFQKLFDEYPRIERVARIIAERFFVNKEAREVELVTLEAKDRYTLFQDRYPELEQKIPQYHIASYLGVSPTQLSRIRKQRRSL